MKEPTLMINIDEFSYCPFLKVGTKCPKNMGQIVSARWRFGTTSPGASTYTKSIPLGIAVSCHGGASSYIKYVYESAFVTSSKPESRVVMKQVGFQLYRTRIGICLSYQQQAGIQGTKLPYVAMVNKEIKQIFEISPYLFILKKCNS